MLDRRVGVVIGFREEQLSIDEEGRKTMITLSDSLSILIIERTREEGAANVEEFLTTLLQRTQPETEQNSSTPEEIEEKRKEFEALIMAGMEGPLMSASPEEFGEIIRRRIRERRERQSS